MLKYSGIVNKFAGRCNQIENRNFSIYVYISKDKSDVLNCFRLKFIKYLHHFRKNVLDNFAHSLLFLPCILIYAWRVCNRLFPSLNIKFYRTVCLIMSLLLSYCRKHCQAATVFKAAICVSLKYFVERLYDDRFTFMWSVTHNARQFRLY